MDPEEKKWFIMGLVFSIMAGGGGITIYIGFMMRIIANQMLQMSITSTLFMIPFYQSLGIGMDQFILFSILSDFSRYTRMLNFFTIVVYIGIAICVTGGALAIVGWVKFFQARQGKL